MDSLTYRGMTMSIIRTLNCEREALLDASGTTYECTRWRASFIVTLGPAALAFLAGNPPTIITPFNPATPQMPAKTDVAIRAFMEQPRGRLIISSLGNVVLVAPQGKAPCDVRNGPFCRADSIVEIPGERLWQMHLTIETYINETPTPTIFLNNRWTTVDDVGWNHLCTRTHAGTCTVRGDLLQQQSPPQIDQFRKTFAGFSVPPNFQRTMVRVQASADGNSVDYIVRDEEQMWNKTLNCPAVRVEVQQSSWTWSSQFMRAFALNPTDVTKHLPRFYARCHVRLHGNNKTPRQLLLSMALTILTNRLGTPAAGDISTDELLIAQDLNNMVDVVSTRSWDQGSLGLLGNIATNVAQWWNATPTNNGFLQFIGSAIQSPNINAIDPTFGITYAITSAIKPGANPLFPGDAVGTRGTFIGQIVQQILEGFDTAPAAVP